MQNLKEVVIIENCLESWEEKHKIFFLFQDDDNNYGCYFGRDKNLENHRTKYFLADSDEKEFFFYAPYEEYTIVFEEMNEQVKFYGEKIIFKSSYQFTKEFYLSLWNSIFEFLKTNEWDDLLSGLTCISELLSSKYSNRTLKVLEDYFARMVLIYYFLNHPEIENNEEIARFCLRNFQTQDKKKASKVSEQTYDLIINVLTPTKKDDLKFTITAPEQNANFENLYFFVKYDFVPQEFGMSLEQLTRNVYEQLEINDWEFPNPLFFKFQNESLIDFFISPDDAQVYLLWGESLPNFSNLQNSDCISRIRYDFDFLPFFEKNVYDEQLELKKFQEYLKKEDYQDE